ncbi:hypothetical protein MASR1M90_11230 [Desulfovibrionales bacterium]
MKRLLIPLLLLVVAGGYWVWTQRTHPPLEQEEARQVAPQRWQVSGAANDSEPDVILAENASQDDVNATNSTNATLPPADSIVGHEFVHDLAQTVASRYIPGQTERNPTSKGRLDLQIKSLNMRYGVDFPGLNVDPADTLEARKTIFAHVLTPAVLEFLHTAYTPLFLDNLEDALHALTVNLVSGQTTSLTTEQRQEMMLLLAAKLRAVGQAAQALATSSTVRGLVSSYIEDMEKVNQAHLNFWNTQEEGGSPAVTSMASAKIKEAIQARELSRQRLLQAIITTANPQGLDASELLYLAQWIYRRSNENPTRLEQVATAASLLVKTATALEERATQNPTQIENQNQEASSQEPGNQTE